MLEIGNDSSPIIFSTPEGFKPVGHDLRMKLRAQMDPQTYGRLYSEDEIKHLESIDWIKTHKPEDIK